MFDWPEGNFVISFSGGRTSAMMLIKLVEKLGPLPERGIVSFQNTGKEDERTLQFINKVSEYTGEEVVWLEFDQKEKGKPLAKVTNYKEASRAGEPFIKAIEFDNGNLPSHQRRFCTRKLKFDTLRRHLRDNLGWKEYTNLIGIRADEPHRVKQVNVSYLTRQFPLVEMGVTKEDVREFWKKMPFDLELPEIMGRNFLGNCTGCFLKSELDLALLCKTNPEEFKWWEGLEERFGSTFKNGWSYRDLREKVESGHDRFNLDGYFCQASQGECTGDLDDV